MIKNFPKHHTNNRNTYKLVTYFLDKVIENKIEINSLVNKDTILNMEKFLMSRGRLYDLKLEDDIIEFDKEIDHDFDEDTKKDLRLLFKDSKIRKELIINNKEEYKQRGKKYLYLYLIFLQIVSDIAKDCKDKANLLYKCFKLYFIEQEKRYIDSLKFLKERAKTFKDFCKLILQYNSKNMESMDVMNEILMDKTVSSINLEKHKELIIHLLGIIKSKKEELYLLTTEVETRVNIKLYIYYLY